MINLDISLLALKPSDFIHSPHDRTIKMEIGSRLKPEYQEAFYTSMLVYVGSICIKNRIGLIEDGRPVFIPPD